MTANFSPLRPALLLAGAILLMLVAAASAAATPEDDLRKAAQQREARQFAAGITGAARVFPNKKLNAPKRFRRALAAAGPRAERFALKVISVRFKPDKKKKKRKKSRKAKSSAAAVERMTVGRETSNLPGGVKAEYTGELRADADGNVDADVEVKLTKGKETLIIRPELDREPSRGPEIECPTADGKLTLKDRNHFGQTIIAKRGGRVIAAVTERTTTEWSATGQVGRDAKLASVSTVSSSKVERYTRGVQVVVNATGTSSTESENGARIVGDVSASASVKIAGLTKAQDSKLESQLAEEAKTDADTRDTLASSTKSSWITFEINQWKWYQLPNYCATLDFEPNWVTLEEGKTLAVQGTVRSQRYGGDASGTTLAPAVSIGSFTTTKADVDPGSPATFVAKAANPGSGTETVKAEVIATSTAGRAMKTFTAEAAPLKVPQSFGGWVEAETIGAGARYKFDAMLEFERTYAGTGPNGFATAWYDLVAITAMHPSINTIGPVEGCRIEAKASSGAVINSGDVELRRESANAPWKYAIQVDFTIPSQWFGMTDCPPDAQLPEWEGDIVNFLYTAPGGSPFRDLWSGSTATDWRLIENGVTDVHGPAGALPTTASWGLIGLMDL